LQKDGLLFGQTLKMVGTRDTRVTSQVTGAFLQCPRFRERSQTLRGFGNREGTGWAAGKDSEGENPKSVRGMKQGPAVDGGERL